MRRFWWGEGLYSSGGGLSAADAGRCHSWVHLNTLPGPRLRSRDTFWSLRGLLACGLHTLAQVSRRPAPACLSPRQNVCPDVPTLARCSLLPLLGAQRAHAGLLGQT